MPSNLSFCFTNIKSPPSPESPAPPLYPSRPFLVKNFNSLYDPASAAAGDTSDSDDHRSSGDPTPDLSAAFASRRFFFSSPGRSNSIVDSTSSHASSSSSLSSASASLDAQRRDTVTAVPTHSPDPYADFRRSMQEMVDARELHDVRESWDYLHELLMCYLSLNPKSTHKFIIGAFADVLVGLITEMGRRKTKGKAKARFHSR